MTEGVQGPGASALATGARSTPLRGAAAALDRPLDLDRSEGGLSGGGKAPGVGRPGQAVQLSRTCRKTAFFAATFVEATNGMRQKRSRSFAST
ncbi:hypothetical protein D3C72_2045070 [compost metagenome]